MFQTILWIGITIIFLIVGIFLGGVIDAQLTNVFNMVSNVISMNPVWSNLTSVGRNYFIYCFTFIIISVLIASLMSVVHFFIKRREEEQLYY